MHDIDTSLLRTFLVLSETLNFSRTAERIGRSQSAASTQIAKLEDILQCRLFDRTKRSVSLTQDGERLLVYARQIVTLSDSLMSGFQDHDIEGEIRFGSPEDFATFYLPDILASFARSHPKITLNVTCDLTLPLIQGFEDGQYDIIVIKQEPQNIYRGAQPLWRERLVWVGRKVAADSNHLNNDFKNKSATLDAASSLPLVLSPAPCVYRARATQSLENQGIPWKISYTSPSVAGVMAAVKAGLGYTVLPRKMVTPDLMAFDEAQGWPALQDAEICLLTAQGHHAKHQSRELSPAQSLGQFITERIHHNL
jgi:DNA-binding transcriptional LysR family regulator